MQSTGAAEGTADLVTANGFAYVVDHDQRGAGSLAQPQQALAKGGHGAGVVFILIVGGIQRVQDDDLRGGRLRRRQEVLQSLRCAEQMSGGAGIDEKVLIRGWTQE